MSTASSSHSKIELQLLGPPLVQWAGETIHIARRSVRALLYYLAAQGEPVSRGQLCLLFWPDIPEASARRNLTRLLTHLRMALPDPSLLVAGEERIVLAAPGYRCDALAFRRLMQTQTPGRAHLESAVGLYRGSFLSGFYLADSSEFENWVSQERAELEVLYLRALERLVDEYTEQRDFEPAIRTARRYLKTDDLAEEIHRKLISLYSLNGERTKALQQYEQCVAILERELGTNPLPETTLVYHAVLDGKPAAALDGREKVVLPSWVGQLSLDIPLIGRGHILADLEKAFAGVKTGSSKVFLVSGEPGIGKTRLLHSLISRCQHQAVVLFGSGELGEMSLPYHPIVEALHAVPNLCPPSLELPWLSEVSRLLPEIIHQQPDLPPPAPLSGDEARIRLYEAICRYLTSLQLDYSPLLLCLDNLHWFDRTSLGWLIHFCRQVLTTSQQILLIATYRSEDEARLEELRESLSRFGLLNDIRLEGLSQENILELLNHALGSLPGKESLASRIRAATGGNPFFILETLRTLGEENKLSSDLEDLVEMPLPNTIRDAVDRRLGRLQPGARQVLEAGAVLGFQFGFQAVRATAGRNELETASHLDLLVSRQLLVTDEDRFQFTHDLVRKATAAAISPMRFTLLHGRAGKALERLEPQAAGAIALHYEISGNLHKALHHTQRAAQAAEAIFAWQEALSLYSAMLKLLDQVDPGRIQPRELKQRGTIYGRLILLDHNLGKSTAREQRFQQLDDLVASSKSKPLELVALMLRARYLHLDGKFIQAQQASEKGQTLALELKDSNAYCRLLAQDGLISFFLGQPDQALVKLESASQLTQQIDDLELRANVLGRLAFIKSLFGKHQQALECHIEARMCHQQLGNAYFAAQHLTEIGDIFATLARYAEAREALSEILDLARKTNLRYDEGHTLLATGWLHMCQGEYETAVQVYSQALEVLYTIQNPHLTTVTEIGLGTAHYHLGNYALSLSWLEKGLASAQKINFRLRLADARLLMTMVEMANENYEIARGYLDEGLAAARQVQSAELTTVGLIISASLDRRTAGLTTALASAEEALQLSQGIDVLACQMWAHTETGLILLAQGQLQDAHMHTSRAIELIPHSHQGWISHQQVRLAHQSVLQALDSG
jgi:DNA-binding SARP family transcriptional activator/DNA polymerase III delta prime subunit